MKKLLLLAVLLVGCSRSEACLCENWRTGHRFAINSYSDYDACIRLEDYNVLYCD